ncbi:MAG: SGNH/GDSL hydrolase family protein [Magnetococcales bacterium]|nr:SGNH/GDSL hydrolase family protein [Magnetococcales bacterium]
MKREWLLAIGITLLTLALSLGMIRWMAPTLLGVPMDMQLVQTDTRAIPFFDALLPAGPPPDNAFILPDPVTRVRNHPLLPEGETLGPHDLLGFRNQTIPRMADVIVIGDSQTYGNNAPLARNWPSQMQEQLSGRTATLYSMAVGGWCGVQYLEMFRKALAFQPRVVVVAFYAGNDPLESFIMAYGQERYQKLRPDPALSPKDAPKVAFPPPESEWEPFTFADGSTTVLTPNWRLGSNSDLPAIRAGYAILAKVARTIAQEASVVGVKVIFALIPTKERVFQQKIRRDGLKASAVYQELVAREEEHATRFAENLAAMPNAIWVDLLPPMSRAALDTALYPDGPDGHPLAAGYEQIAQAIAPKLRELLPAPTRGLVAVMTDQKSFQVWLMTRTGRWLVPADPERIAANGWSMESLKEVPARDVASVPILGVMERDPARFGPEAVTH